MMHFIKQKKDHQVIQFVTFLSPNVGGHQQPLKGSCFHHPKKGHQQNYQALDFVAIFSSKFSGGRILPVFGVVTSRRFQVRKGPMKCCGGISMVGSLNGLEFWRIPKTLRISSKCCNDAGGQDDWEC